MTSKIWEKGGGNIFIPQCIMKVKLSGFQSSWCLSALTLEAGIATDYGSDAVNGRRRVSKPHQEHKQPHILQH